MAAVPVRMHGREWRLVCAGTMAGRDVSEAKCVCVCVCKEQGTVSLDRPCEHACSVAFARGPRARSVKEESARLCSN